MKKIKLYSYGLMMSVGLLLSGCDKFLGHEPDDRMKINTLEKVQQTLNGAYNDYGVRFTDLSSDNVGLADGVFGTMVALEDLYTWSRDMREQDHQDSPGAYWREAYRAISNVNIALDALEKLELAEEEQAWAGAIRGEALVLRSYYHFMLVNLFAPHYNELVSKKALGVPYMKEIETDLVAHYERATVDEVYRLAEEDLLEGIQLLEANREAFNPNKYHFTFPTVYLYASRFYLFRNRNEADVEAAIEYSEKSIAAFGGLGVMRDWLEYSSDSYGPLDINQPEVGMLQSSFTYTIALYAYQYTKVIQSKYFRHPFKLVDNRQQMAYKAPGDIYLPVSYYVVNPNGNETTIDIFPFSEALLNAAESYARHGDYQKSLDLMHEFGKHIYDSYDRNSVTLRKLVEYYGYFTEENGEGLALIDYILYERRIQFLFHGMRWFDMRRYQIDASHKLVNGEIVVLMDVNPDMDYQIPRYAIEAGMTPNSR